MGTLNQAISGAYALPEDQWRDLVGQAPEAAMAMLESIARIVER